MPSEAELESSWRAALQGHTSQGRAFPAARQAVPAHHPELRWTRCPPAPGFDLGLPPAPQIPPETPAGLSGFAVLAKPFHTDTALLQLLSAASTCSALAKLVFREPSVSYLHIHLWVIRPRGTRRSPSLTLCQEQATRLPWINSNLNNHKSF